MKGKSKAILGRYVAPFVLFAAVAMIVAISRAPASWFDWLVLAALVPAGGGGALLGDRAGIWLKANGFGRP